jgi:phytoene synthase
MAQALLQELEKSDYPVMSHRLSLTPLRKLWLAWRSRRGITA